MSIEVTDQALINLVIAAREAFDTGCLPDDEQRALDRALESYAAVVPYADDPTSPALSPSYPMENNNGD